VLIQSLFCLKNLGDATMPRLLARGPFFLAAVLSLGSATAFAQAIKATLQSQPVQVAIEVMSVPGNMAANSLAGKESESSVLPLNKLVSLRIVFTTQDGAAREAELLKFDAVMPEHRHGMMVKPVLKKIEPHAYQVDGVKLHMAGKWELELKIKVDGKDEDLKIPYVL